MLVGFSSRGRTRWPCARSPPAGLFGWSVARGASASWVSAAQAGAAEWAPPCSAKRFRLGNAVALTR